MLSLYICLGLVHASSAHNLGAAPQEIRTSGAARWSKAQVAEWLDKQKLPQLVLITNKYKIILREGTLGRSCMYIL